MRRHVFRTLLLGGATAAAVALGAGQAFAADTITITGAGGIFSATSTNAVISDTTSGQSFRCTSISFGGTVANVTNAPLPYTSTGADGSSPTITRWSFTGCMSSFGSATLTVPAAGLSNDFVFTAVSSAAPQASGHLRTPVNIHVTVLTCSFDIASLNNFTWSNGMSNQLKFIGSLHPANVSAGCFGEVSPNDILTFPSIFTVMPNTIMIGPGQ